MLGEKTLSQADALFMEQLKQELRDQGHFLTGELEDSIAAAISISGSGLSADVSALDYINPLDTGVPASKIDLNNGGYIAGLIRYAELRFGASGPEAERIAYAIAAKHKLEGMPTKASYQYSDNGRRTQAIEQADDQSAKSIDQEIENGISSELDNFLEMGAEIEI